MTQQEIFDKVYTHLLTQNKKSVIGEYCAYRGMDDTMCAVGCLVSDDIYVPEMENLRVSTLIARKLAPHFFCEHLKMLRTLQHIHDCVGVDNWKKELDFFAELYNLTIPELV